MHCVILGNGITGITAARTIRKNTDHEITVISGETDYFFSRTALMYVYMGHMKFEHIQPYENWFWEKNKINLKKAWVKTIDTNNKNLLLDNNESISYDKLLIATGAKSNKFGWPGQDLKGVQGLYSYQDLLELEENTHQGINRGVIVGGGLIGIEMAEMLHSRHYPVTFLVRESNYWNNVLPEQESKMISNHIREHGFDLKLGVTLKEIKGDANGKVKSVITNTHEEIPCNVVGLTAGVSPNIDLIKQTDIQTDRGVVINYHMHTNVEDIFAAGDCAQFQHALPDRKVVEQVWYTGKLQGECAALNMIGKKTLYDPGFWYNSAKFLDIEYQTYGTVMPKLREGEKEFYWQHADGKKCMHFVYKESDHLFIGINVFGIRLRHAVFNRWLKEKRTIEYVLENLKAANFEPEFFSTCEEEIIAQWNAETKNNIQLKNKKSLIKMIFN
ncbi:MAG: NAD(P)/FAD-dependent oxidoreductase [Fimbriimonadaceae bacterium]|nr:NAD(P)/FAD-dependent oxidoreductase [Chitinophagales bacterium]